MIGPAVKEVQPQPRPGLKRKQPPPEIAVKRPPGEVEDIVSEVCNYETISDYIQLFGGEEQGGSPASLESGYQTGAQDSNDEDSNLSWLLNFKVSSLFDPTEDKLVNRKEEQCVCAGAGHLKTPDPGKPPFTYTELIERALREQGQLTVSGIYSWISTKYPYYNPGDDRWKNSVRHNLSINPHFRKGVKSRHGAGHLWTLSDEGVNPPPESWKKFRASIARRSPSPVMDEAAIAAASIMQLDPEVEETHDPGLHRVAEEILSGVKRRVEVQYLVHDQNSNEADLYGVPDHTIILTLPPHASWSTSHKEFLNPISKEEIVSESGLNTSNCEAEATNSLLCDLNSELHLPDNLFSDELAFTCY